MQQANRCVHNNVWFSLDRQIKQSVPFITNVVRSNPAQARCTIIQHYVIKFVSDLRQVGGFLRVLRFPLDTNIGNKTDRHDITEILLNVAFTIY
jgi:hypothetical protein